MHKININLHDFQYGNCVSVFVLTGCTYVPNYVIFVARQPISWGGGGWLESGCKMGSKDLAI